MKTILYQPLFINPQAYFVFPQLYHIEKGDSYIEPANITGQLIINDLTQSLTSTPILNVVQDTNQVDFGLFKGKHIRISQYTNIGAVVLGEWYIPGTPTPPEPEQPDWFKESIVAWYSPYCKQRMTNFDVIESYADDFTKWRIENTGVTSTQKKIVIAAGTELKYNVAYKDFGNSIAEFDIKYTGNAVIRYQYNKEDGTTGIITINRSGIYHLPASIKAQKNFGFYCNPQTVTEEATIEQLPTSILKDFSGNGNHAYLHGGKGKLNSGMGVYKFDFLSDLHINSAYIPYCDRQEDKICSLIEHPAGWLFQFISLSDIPAFKVEVKGIVNDRFVYRYYDENGNRGKEIIINKDGIYELPISYSVENNTGVGIVCSDACVDNVCFTQIPDYPDQLCYDDKMYAVAYNMPILTDYTVIADGSLERVQSLGAWNTITINTDNVVSYLTKNKYNNSNIKNGIGVDEDVLCIGGSYQKETNNINIPFIGCHGNILLFNRSLTEYEISWVKNNMMCSKPQEPDIDL